MAASADDDGYEYVFRCSEYSHHRPLPAVLIRLVRRYEALPPNFSLAANMVAGAFAGIAVCARSAPARPSDANVEQEHSVMYPIDLLKVRS
jgi:solute carrier family 25 (mitochondrial iron transporter), member 28/37